MRAAVSDSHGVVHGESLYIQLGLAAGIANAQLQPLGKNVCASPAYDCFGAFYDAAGHATHAPPFRAAAIQTEEDLKRWKASVASFFRGAYTDARAQAKLAPGKAALCTTAVLVRSQAHPDPSIDAAFTMLQQLGAETSLPDVAWLDAIDAAGVAAGCGALPLPPNHDMDSWLVPEQSVQKYVAELGDCALPTVVAYGHCPHSFDPPKGPGNFVKARPIADLRSCGRNATWVIGDPTGGCGMSCYRAE